MVRMLCCLLSRWFFVWVGFSVIVVLVMNIELIRYIIRVISSVWVVDF